MPLLSNKHLILVRITVYVGYDSLRWLDSLNHGTLYFFRHRIFHSALVKLSLGHCIALLVVFIIGKVLSSYRSYVQRHCCQGLGVEFMQMNL